jgi:CheY-like chemotaxis protein
LKRLGCSVDSAWNGAEAIATTAHTQYDLVLMDCHMPEVDGFEATRAIRAREAAAGAPRRPIVALTASVLEEDRRSCEVAGMDGFIGKPMRPNDLAEMLERFVPASGVDA